jgi:Cd2+/Zn2+-exporting ATPase
MKTKLTKKQKKNLRRIIIAAALLASVWILTELVELPWFVCLALFLAPYLICGYDVLLKACRNIAHGHVFDENFLMAIATIGAFAVAEYPEATFVMLFYQVGELFQSISVGKSRRAISDLMDICPDVARVVRDTKTVEVSPDEVAAGEIVECRPGDKIPLDGTVIEGCSSINTAALTGESIPRDVVEGDAVTGGTVNLTGLLRIRTNGTFADSTVSKVLELVENSSEKKAKAENFITKFARYYTPAVVICAVLLAAIPPLFLGVGSWDVWKTWIERAMIFLVVSCPCALVVSVPLSFFGAIGGASKRGVLIKGANYMETLSKIGCVVFDKTGTLTEGRFEVSAVHPEQIGEDELLDLAALAESCSAHPIAESIVRAHGGHLATERLGAITEEAGLGVIAEVDGVKVAVGNPRLMEKVGAKWHPCHHAGNVIHVAADGVYAGHIVIEDKIKESSPEAVGELRKIGVRQSVMLSGDSEENAKLVAGAVGLDSYRASLLPEQKVSELEGILEEAHAKKETVAFVGDGINDAPVLTRADVGIAMGALGSDAAIEAADVVLMNDRPTDVVRAIKIARRTMKIVWQNVIFALVVKLAIMVLGAFGIAGMWLAVFADVGVLVIATLNASRTLKSKD